MALRDKFEKIISYFDTEDASELVEEASAPERPGPSQTPRRQPDERSMRPSEPVRQPLVDEQPKAPSQRPAPPQAYPRPTARPDVAPQPQVSPPRPTAPREKPVHPNLTAQVASPFQQVSGLTASASQPVHQQAQTETKIALRYPRRYEDAPALVDLLVNKECVLIDFEHMEEEYEARRCLDFIDGASKVLNGSLRRVGATTYLLVPSHVQVDMSDLPTGHRPAQADFDYDMKRR